MGCDIHFYAEVYKKPTPNTLKKQCKRAIIKSIKSDDRKTKKLKTGSIAMKQYNENLPTDLKDFIDEEEYYEYINY